MTASRGVQVLTADDRALLAEALAARARAHAPYSRFAVGAAVRSRTGRVHTGCNVENATSGLTLCAERVACFSAITDGDVPIGAIAVVVPDGKPARPCGICRQLLREIAPDVRILLADGRGGATLTTLDDLLPELEEET